MVFLMLGLSHPRNQGKGAIPSPKCPFAGTKGQFPYTPSLPGNHFCFFPFGTWLNSRPCTCRGKAPLLSYIPSPLPTFILRQPQDVTQAAPQVAQETSNLKLPHLGLLRNWNPTPEPPSQASTIHVWNSHKNPRTSPKTTLGPLRRGNL